MQKTYSKTIVVERQDGLKKISLNTKDDILLASRTTDIGHKELYKKIGQIETHYYYVTYEYDVVQNLKLVSKEHAFDILTKCDEVEPAGREILDAIPET